jgi:hypothetical protein
MRQGARDWNGKGSGREAGSDMTSDRQLSTVNRQPSPL